MGAILKSTSTFIIFAIALLTIMATLSLPLGPLLASAGVGGIALAFGAQSLVKDVLSGIFMILEDQYDVGDVIDTGEAIGTVEDVTLRVTKVRDASGVVWYIRNGEIVRIGNRSQGWSTAVVDIQVSYNESLDIVLPLIREVAHGLDGAPEWRARLLEEPVVARVESMVGGVITIRIIAKCAPNRTSLSPGRSASGSRPLSTQLGSVPHRLGNPITVSRVDRVAPPTPETERLVW
jgi:small-conductance mechanosensitive channel